MTEALLLSLPRDTLLNICSNFTAPQLSLTRLVCRLLQEIIDETTQNPLWKDLALREGLRPMTTEEKNSQTYQTYLQKNWKFCLLNKTPAECLTPRLLYRIRAAIRSGHTTLVCQSLDRWEKQSILWKVAYEFASESIDARLGDPFLKLISPNKCWSLQGHPKEEMMGVLFIQTALRGEYAMMKGLLDLHLKKSCLIRQGFFVHAFYLSASRGDVKMLQLLLNSSPNPFSQNTVDRAYSETIVFSPHPEATEFLRAKASTKAQQQEKDVLVDFYKNQFCTAESELSSTILQQRAEFYLKQDGFFDSLNDAQKKNIIKRLKKCSNCATFQLFMTHPQFAPLIAADKELLIILMRDVYDFNEWYTIESLISFLKTLEKAPPHGKRDFKSYAAAIVWSALIFGRDDFIKSFVQNFTGLIPADLIPLFLEAALNSSDDVPKLLKVGSDFKEFHWFCKFDVDWFFSPIL
ncbi:MAG TPA: F-box protein [Rhabdochlamydiaceae bacterium]|jgi:hypothetical protein|nr:F-box protein [Rhabdochlamydiaceae bacterium]